MPRIRQNADKYAVEDFLAEIKAQCGRFGYTSQKSLGDALGVCQATVGSYLKNPADMKFATLRMLVSVLKPDPIVVLKALGYTAKDIQKLKGGPGA